MRALLLALCAAGLAAEERFPPPDFTTAHVIPGVTTPGPRALWLLGLDAVLLVAALGLAAWLVHRKRSRRGVIVLSLCCLAWFGFYRAGCTCSVGAVQNVAAATFAGEALPWLAALFFAAPLLAALFVGRVFCAAVCPLGAIQDAVLVRPLNVPPWLAGALGVLPWAWLGLGVLSASLGGWWLICRFDPFVGFFRFGGPAEVMLAGAGLLLISTVVGRPYCRFLCPYSVLLRLAAPLAALRVRIAPERCTACRLCEGSCPFGAIQPPSPPAPAQRVSSWAIATVVLLPLLLGAGAWLGWRSGPTLALLNPQVALAESLVTPPAAGSAAAVDLDTFHRLGGSDEELAAQAVALRRQWSWGAALLGGALALVVAVKLVRASRRPRRSEYLADEGHCLACARCLPTCPEGKVL